MPFATNAELPQAIKDRYSDRCQDVFRRVFNETDGDDAQKFPIATTAANTCKAAGKEIDMDLHAVKFSKGSDTRIEGLAIPFGGPKGGKDLEDEDFGPDTDFALDWFPNGRPVIYHHDLHPRAKGSVQGRQLEHELTDEGLFARGELDKSAKYHSTVAQMVKDGKLFFSSGTMSHLVETDPSGHIKRWPWVELSLTPTPANPFATVYAVKSTDLIDHLAAVDAAIPAPLVAAALKAWDEHDGPELPAGTGFAESLDRVSTDLSAIVARASARKDWHAKSGRELSASNRRKVQGAIEAIDSLRPYRDELDGLLQATDPGVQQKAAQAAYLRFLEAEARFNGVTA